MKSPIAPFSILLFALAEEMMLDCLAKRMNTSAKASWKQAIGTGGLLSTASNRLTLLELLYWIKPQTGADLRLMKSIRNKFAHHADVHEFSERQILGWITSMTKHEGVLEKIEEAKARSKFTARQQFEMRSVATLCHLAMDLAVGPVAREAQVYPGALNMPDFDSQPQNMKDAVLCQAECLLIVTQGNAGDA